MTGAGSAPNREFARGWPIVAAAASGAGLGLSGLLTYNSGLFQPALAQEAGVGAGRFGLALFVSTLSTAAAVPLIGAAVDRYGARAVAAVGAALLAVGFVALGTLVRTPATFILIMALTGLLGVGCTPVPFTRAVSAAFERSRGLALGLTQVGIGLSATLVPPVIGRIIAEQGWRTGYFALAGLALVGVVPALLALPGARASRGATARAGEAAMARRSALFGTQLAAFVAMAFAFAGMLPQFVPMLVKAGLPLPRAAAFAGAIGLSVIGSRLVIGWLADRIDPAWLGAASCLICGGGCLLFGLGGAAKAVWAAIAFGTAMGAEADLIAILTARHFPIDAYGRLYAPQYAAFTLAAGISPMWVGYLADWAGSYRPALYLAATLLLAPTALFAALPAVRRRDVFNSGQAAAHRSTT